MNGFTPFLYRGLEHLRILVSVGVGGGKRAIPGIHGDEGTTQVFGTDELDGTAPLNPHIIQGPTVSGKN